MVGRLNKKSLATSAGVPFEAVVFEHKNQGTTAKCLYFGRFMIGLCIKPQYSFGIN